MNEADRKIAEQILQIKSRVPSPPKAHCHATPEHRTKEYTAWIGALGRCSNENNPHFKYYGARGITVCAGWMRFENFIADMGTKPTLKHSIDRKDNDGNYSCGRCEQCLKNGWPRNCRWATPLEQANNSRKNHKLTFSGRTLNIKQWAMETGIHDRTISTRLARGWPIERALTEPLTVGRPKNRTPVTSALKREKPRFEAPS